jgi:hypothetical protein
MSLGSRLHEVPEHAWHHKVRVGEDELDAWTSNAFGLRSSAIADCPYRRLSGTPAGQARAAGVRP